MRTTPLIALASSRPELTTSLEEIGRGRFRVERFERQESAPPGAALLLLDVATNGLGLGRAWRERNPDREFFAIVESDTSGVAALRAGAFDYFVWPITNAGALGPSK